MTVNASPSLRPAGQPHLEPIGVAGAACEVFARLTELAGLHAALRVRARALRAPPVPVAGLAP
eukprot:CAMPEP_0175469052 /NCGR_PEP_ID=MMETSP0095-20121207/72139_1 /TAXON_ID=311494 /ORGANISM="Alexandrium monilatum, Strain CCMP3105" /LENGTH=62 /DNA_ID=CAMNT_0016770449 /DNA_START=46 /DNA_END=231 /DNA_ORIENTATION=+